MKQLNIALDSEGRRGTGSIVGVKLAEEHHAMILAHAEEHDTRPSTWAREILTAAAGPKAVREFGEKAAMKRAADDCGMSASAWMRTMLLAVFFPDHDPPLARQMKRARKAAGL